MLNWNIGRQREGEERKREREREREREKEREKERLLFWIITEIWCNKSMK